MNAMVIDWVFSVGLLLTLLIPAAWGLSRLMRRVAGARAAYACWLLPLVALVPPGSLPLATAAVALPTWVVGAAPESQRVIASAGTGFVWLLAVWSVGVVLFLVWLGFRQLRFQRWLGTGGMISQDPGLEALGARLPRVLPIRLSARCQTPMLVGFLPPKLYLPMDFPSRPGAERAMVLRHELAHLRHGDPWWNVLGVALRAVFWFHPLVHLAWFRFRGDQELAADEAVMDALDQRERVVYARLLCATAGLRLPSIGLGGFLVSSLKERVVMIDQANGKRFPAKAGLFAAILLALSAGLAVAATGTAGGNPEFDREGYLPVERVEPKWPKSALIEGTTGSVHLEATVDRDGQVLDARVLDASPEGVFEAVSLDAIKQWRFPERPASQPASVTVHQVIEYRLDHD